MYASEWLARREELSPERVALTDLARGARPITYREWNRAANRTARLLAERAAIGKGDRVAVLAHNRVEYLDLFFALGKIGAVLLTLNWRLAARELRGLLAHARPKALAYGAELAPLAREIAAGLPAQLVLVSLDDEDEGPDVLRLCEREALSDGPLPDARLRPDHPWVVCFTGGTTGLPKGAVLSHGSITANAVNTVVSWGLRADDTAILDAPLFHTGGLNVFTTPLVYVGGRSIVCTRFQPGQAIDLIERGGVTLYFGVPTMLMRLADHPRFPEADLAGLRILISGGAPCPPALLARFFERGVAMRTGYGLTEAGPNNFWLPEGEVRRRPGSVGVPLMHVEARIAGAYGEKVPPGEVGELCLRGPHLFAGYLDDEAATREALRSAPDDPTGAPWLHTGDLARLDEDGFYHIVGRQKDMFISGGENVYPAEIESALHEHPEVVEAAVIGVPDAIFGEAGKALVVLRAGARGGAEDILAFLRARLAGYKLPRSIVFVESLPRTGAGKLDRRLIREQHGG